MSTILEALRERDGGETPVALIDDPVWMRWRRPLVAIVGVVAIGAAVHSILRMPPPPPSRPDATAHAVQQPVRPVPPPARTVERPSPARTMAEPPRARVERWLPAAPPPASSVAADAASAAAQTPPVPAAAPDKPAESTLRLESIYYAKALGERTVALAIDGAPSVSLRQGESSGGVEVQLILPEAVYVRRGAEVFALGTVR